MTCASDTSPCDALLRRPPNCRNRRLPPNEMLSAVKVMGADIAEEVDKNGGLC